MELIVNVEQLTANENLPSEDIGIEGTYLVTLRDDTPGEYANSAALDGFAVNIPINTPENFEITVEDNEGNPQEDPIPAEPYTLDSYCLSVVKVTDDEEE